MLVKTITAKICSVEGCDRPALAKGLCGLHYRRMRQHGDPHQVKKVGRKKATGTCRIEGCDKPVYALGLCKIHYLQQYKEQRKLGSSANLANISNETGVSVPDIKKIVFDSMSEGEVRKYVHAHLSKQQEIEIG